MFRFENPYYLWLLVGILPLGIILILARRWYNRQAKKLGEVALISQLTETFTAKKWAWILVIWICLTMIG